MQARVPVTSTCSSLQRGGGLNLDKTRKLFCAHEAGKEILQIVGNEALHLGAKYRGREFATKKKKKFSSESLSVPFVRPETPVLTKTDF